MPSRHRAVYWTKLIVASSYLPVHRNAFQVFRCGCMAYFLKAARLRPDQENEQPVMRICDNRALD